MVLSLFRLTGNSLWTFSFTFRIIVTQIMKLQVMGSERLSFHSTKQSLCIDLKKKLVKNIAYPLWNFFSSNMWRISQGCSGEKNFKWITHRKLVWNNLPKEHSVWLRSSLPEEGSLVICVVILISKECKVDLKVFLILADSSLP